MTATANTKNKIQIGFTLWFTGLSGAGKSTIAEILETKFPRPLARSEL